MDPFLEKFFPVVYRKKNYQSKSNYCKYDNQGLSAFTSSLYLAGLVASIGASTVTRKYGRRISIICGGFSFLTGAGLNAGAVNLAMLLLGRIMLGVGIGFGNQVILLLFPSCSWKHRFSSKTVHKAHGYYCAPFTHIKVEKHDHVKVRGSFLAIQSWPLY